MSLDTNLFFLLNNFAGKSYLLDLLFIFLASYLPYLFVAVFLLLLYYSAYTNHKKIIIFLVAFISAAIARFGIEEIIHLFYQRPRPFITYHVHQLIQESGLSFPSGHSSFFFAMATAIFLFNRKWGTWFFVAAIFMNLSRIIVGVHYPSDILGGIVVGIFSALATYYFMQKMKLKNLITNI